VDNSLAHESKSSDYGIPVRELRDPHILFQDTYRGSTKLYKLHGSLNWLYCAACRAVDLTPGRKGAVHIFQNNDLSTCPICGIRYEPIIITPTFLKKYDNYFVKQLWHQAEQCLQTAQQVVFIGYSLPDADIALRTVLARSFYRNRVLSGQLQRVTVVDYNPCIQNPTREKYERLFGSIDYFNEGFNSYVQNQIYNK
jgi:hypothetical protein